MKTKSIVTVLLVAFVLASCVPAVKVVPTKTAIPTLTFIPVPPTPTITQTPIPTLDIEGQNIPDPRFSNPELFDLEKPNAPIPQFVHALSLAGVDVSAQTINESLMYQIVKAKNGDMAILLMTTDLAETSYNEGNIPLLIYMKVSQTSGYVWSVAHLKDAASLHDILMGVVIDGFERLNDIDPQLFDQNFNMVTMTWSSVDVPFDEMDNGQKYRLSEIADRDLEEIMWFHLGDVPLQNQTFQTKEEAVAFAKSEIDKIVQKYGDNITIANIFNEVNPDNGDIVYKLWKRFGDDFIIEVYQHVREILPDRKIIVNNSFNYSKTIEGSTYLYTLEYANLLKSHNLIDAVGMEMHQAQSSWGVDHPLVIDDAVEIMRSFGLPVYVTELDVNQTYLPGTDQEKRIEQAKLYEDVVRTCVRSGVCEMINFWGSTDQSSWYEFAVGEPNANAGIFEDDGTSKLAYYAILRGLTEGYVSSPP